MPLLAGGRCSVRAVTKSRIDAVLADRGLFPSRTAAAGAVRAGEGRVGQDGPIALRPSQLGEPDTDLIVDVGPRYASRGGIKLANALEALGVDPAGRDCLDVGASTGGFTDCLLKGGARHVVALDVAAGELHWSLGGDERVTVVERVNARSLDPASLPYAPDLIAVDVSFISLRKVLPAVIAAAAPRFDCLALVKPQFEVGRERVGKGGVVRSPEHRREAIDSVAAFARESGWAVVGTAESGLPGPAGNVETFVWIAEGDRA